MHRIDSSGATADNKFTDGNPAVGQEGTVVDADWLNDVQENIAHAIEAAGITLVKGDSTQLAAAIVALIAGVVGSGGGAVPTTREVNGGGLVTGGGALAADLTLAVAKSTPAAIIAGVDDDSALTPAQLAGAIGATAGDPVNINLPGGAIIKMGTIGASMSEGQRVVNFPAAFPNACYRVFFTPINATADKDNDIWIQRVSVSAAGFVAFVNYDGSGTNQIDGFDWMAIGR